MAGMPIMPMVHVPDPWQGMGMMGHGKGAKGCDDWPVLFPGDPDPRWRYGTRARQTIHARMQDAMASWRHFPMSRVSTVSLSLSVDLRINRLLREVMGVMGTPLGWPFEF